MSDIANERRTCKRQSPCSIHLRGCDGRRVLRPRAAKRELLTGHAARLHLHLHRHLLALLVHRELLLLRVKRLLLLRQLCLQRRLTRHTAAHLVELATSSSATSELTLSHQVVSGQSNVKHVPPV